MSRRAREPEVEHLQGDGLVRLLREEEIARLDVAMNDPGGVRFGDAVARLEDQLHGVGNRVICAIFQLFGEVLADELLHHDVGFPLRRRPDVHHANDVLAHQPRRRLRFSENALEIRARGRVAPLRTFTATS